MNTVAPFPTDPALTAIAIAFCNQRLIADEVLPRTPVGRQEFKWRYQPLAEGFTVPPTLVSRTGQPNQVQFTGEEMTSSTEDHALDAPVPQADVENAPPGYDPEGNAAEQTTNLILLDREVRCSNAVFSASVYGVNNTDTLSGTDQWSDPASDPLRAITDYLDSLVMRPNIGVLGRPTATALRRHPKIVKAYNGSSGDEGMVPLAFLSELLELESIQVGESRLNIARPGQAADLQRVWGPHAAFLYRDKLAGPQAGTTFGFTAQFGGRIANKTFDKDIGMRGGNVIRIGESVREVIAAPELGFFVENAVAG